MSRRRRAPARSRSAQQRRSDTPAVRSSATSASRQRSRAAVDPISVYRDAAGYGRVMRSSLIIALTLLVISLAIRAAGHQPPGELGVIGALFVLVFFAGGMIRHYRGIYRVRRYNPDAWRPSARFVAGMMLAPFGIGNPRNTRADTVILRLTLVLAVALVALLIAVNALNR